MNLSNADTNASLSSLPQRNFEMMRKTLKKLSPISKTINIALRANSASVPQSPKREDGKKAKSVNTSSRNAHLPSSSNWASPADSLHSSKSKRSISRKGSRHPDSASAGTAHVRPTSRPSTSSNPTPKLASSHTYPSTILIWKPGSTRLPRSSGREHIKEPFTRHSISRTITATVLSDTLSMSDVSAKTPGTNSTNSTQIHPSKARSPRAFFMPCSYDLKTRVIYSAPSSDVTGGRHRGFVPIRAQTLRSCAAVH